MFAIWGRSAIQAARNVLVRYGLPMSRIELTPMIGVNAVVSNVFTLDAARLLAESVRDCGLGGLHFWSLDRDAPRAPGVAEVRSLMPARFAARAGIRAQSDGTQSLPA